MREQLDFTQGDLIRSILLFSFPIIMGELLQSLYNSVDSLIVGNFVSETAFAAVTACGMISNMVVTFFNGMPLGSNIAVSKAHGSGDLEETRRSAKATFSFSILLGTALSAIGIVLTPRLLRLANVHADYYFEAMREDRHNTCDSTQEALSTRTVSV